MSVTDGRQENKDPFGRDRTYQSSRCGVNLQTPPSGEAESKQVREGRADGLVSLACKDQHVATGIARRIIDGRDNTMASILLDKYILQAKKQECNGLREIRKAFTFYKLQLNMQKIIEMSAKLG